MDHPMAQMWDYSMVLSMVSLMVVLTVPLMAHLMALHLVELMVAYLAYL